MGEIKKQNSKIGRIPKKHNIVGYAILLLGIVSFLAVSVIGYKTFFTETKKVSSIKKRKLSSPKPKVSKKINSALEKLLSAPRQQSILLNSLVGQWVASTQKGVCLFKINKQGGYRIILIEKRKEGKTKRIYSQGNFTMEEDIIQFTPDRSIKPPIRPGEGKIYSRNLTVSGFPVMVSRHSEQLIWKRPSKDVKIYVPNDHPVLRHMDENIAIFKRLKEGQ